MVILAEKSKIKSIARRVRSSHILGVWIPDYKRRWLDKVKDDIKEKRLSADDMYDSATWRCMSSYTSTPHKSGNKMKEKKKEE